jgi:mannitol/fructose-specific phosphotransferase system IIA component (Ntr-type)
MPRPKKLKTPSRLNLLVEGQSKKAAFRLACDRRISIGHLFEQLVDAEEKREKKMPA